MRTGTLRRAAAEAAFAAIIAMFLALTAGGALAEAGQAEGQSSSTLLTPGKSLTPFSASFEAGPAPVEPHLVLTYGDPASETRTISVGLPSPRATGKCYVRCVDVGIDPSTGHAKYPAKFELTMPDGQAISAECLDRDYPVGLDGWYSFTATERADGSYDVEVHTQYSTSDKSQIHPDQRPYLGDYVVFTTQRVGNAIWPKKGAIDLQKASSEDSITSGNPCYSLKGAEYGVYRSKANANADKSRVATLKTNASGYAKADDIAAGTYYVKETKAPEGYAKDTAVYAVTVMANETTRVNGSKVHDTPLNDPDGLLLVKRDAETNKPISQGKAELALAEYTFEYYPGLYQSVKEARATGDPDRIWVLRTDADGFTSIVFGDDTFDFNGRTYSYKVSGDDFFRTDGLITLPLGTIVIAETKAPAGYQLDSYGPYIARIVQNGSDVAIEGDVFIEDKNTCVSSTEQIIRGDLSFEKKSDSDALRMAGVPFMISSETTGESHVVVTDANGQFTSSSEYNAHTQKTNANDDAVTGDAQGGWSVDEEALDPDAGVWFGGGDVDDSKGAFPYDTYTIEELPCSANEGNQLIEEAGIVVSRDGFEIDLGTIDDPAPGISTYATDAADGDKSVSPDSNSTILDRVSYYGLAAGASYSLESWVEAADGSGPVSGTERTEFVATSRYGTIEVGIEVDTLHVAGVEMVACQRLYDASGRQLAEHADLADQGQTVRVDAPTLDTEASSSQGSHTVVADPEAVVEDEVSYGGLVPGEAYVLETRLVDALTGEEASLAGGSPSLTEFVPETPGGRVSVRVTADLSTSADGETYAVCQSLTKDGVTVAEHADLADADQAVQVIRPAIDTVAADSVDGDKNVVADPSSVVVDRVSYENLLPGVAYGLETGLVHADSGEAVLDGAGDPVSSTTEFVPEETSGAVEVNLAFDASGLGGRRLVVTQRLTRGGVAMAEHADAADVDQSFEAVKTKIATEAMDAADGDSTVEAAPGASVRDVLSYSDAIPGETYEAFGVLVDPSTGLPASIDGDGESAEAWWGSVLEALSDGRLDDEEREEVERARPDGVVTSRTEFSSEASGEAILEYSFDATSLDGATLVCFAAIARDGFVAAVHADAGSDAQSVSFLAPKISTELVDATDGDHEALVSKTARLVDAVRYDGLRPGKEYALECVLMDGETGERILDAGGFEVVARERFTANSPSGTAEVEVEFDASGLGGRKVVAFEYLTLDGEPVAEHADLGDAGQTVEFVEPPRGLVYDKTGGIASLALIAIAALSAAGAGLVWIGTRKDGGR